MKAKRIFVTGATGGIGAAVVQKLLNSGHSVVGGDILTAEESEFVKDGLAYDFHKFDICDMNECEKVIAKAAETLGGLDCIVNVAGVCFGGDPETADEDEWAKTFDINVKGVFQFTKAALPFLKQQDRADIINISSIWGVDHNPNLLSYSSSKFAIEGYSGGLRQWGMTQNIRVCALQVDKVDTGFRRNLGAAGELPKEKLADMLTSEDVAEAVDFVLSTKATSQVSSMRLDAPLWYQD
ncbi:MAG: SDR family oxidoreductase [Hyphomicrobiales bacterium]